MSVDLFCYTSKTAESAGKTIDSILESDDGTIRRNFSISLPKAVKADQKDIALEHQFLANAIFLVHLANKGSAQLINCVSSTIKSAFGIEEILILHNNDTVM